MDGYTVVYEYKGSRFRLEKQRYLFHKTDYYLIIEIVTAGGQLCLPDSYQGFPITYWAMKEGEQHPLVKSLYIPAGITDIRISNQLFPGLEEVRVQAGHPSFSSDGRMLYSADGKELFYSLAGGNQQEAVVPEEVKRISGKAFQYAPCIKIQFGNPDVNVEGGSFRESGWIKAQGDFCIVGNLFYRLNKEMEELVLPKGIRRFHENAFLEKVPLRLVTQFMPPRKVAKALCGRGRRACRELAITSPHAVVSFRTLREFSSLEAVHLLETHKKYCSRDGVIFSKDMKRLEFYPQAKKDSFYRVPDGVAKIAKEAFAGQGYLEGVVMPDTVTTVGMGAFMECRRLRQVEFPKHIKEIPDASAYQNGGVFESCLELKEAVLPQGLRYLGSRAFYNSGMEKIILNDKLKQVGEYALAAKGIQEVMLPPSLERIGKGALLYVRKTDAYAGTAKGLVSSVNAAPPGCLDKSANVEWTRCMVYVHHKKGDGISEFLIPGSLKRNAAYHLDLAWNGEGIDYGEYDACFEAITDSAERMEFAKLGILRVQDGEDTPYAEYIRRCASRIAVRLLEEGKEKEFLALLKKGYLSDAALGKLLKLSNKNNLTTCSAYILKYQDLHMDKKKKRFVL